jgi:hypothetical protein
VFPNRVSLHIAAIEDKYHRSEKIDFWDSVYGFTMCSMKEEVLIEAVVTYINPEQIISNAIFFKVRWLNWIENYFRFSCSHTHSFTHSLTHSCSHFLYSQAFLLTVCSLVYFTPGIQY